MPFLVDFEDLIATFQQAIPASAVGALVNLLYEKTFSSSEFWIKRSYRKLSAFGRGALLDITVSQKVPSSCHTCSFHEQRFILTRAAWPGQCASLQLLGAFLPSPALPQVRLTQWQPRLSWWGQLWRDVWEEVWSL